MYKVLIVDDEAVICKGLQALIDWEMYGFEVTDDANNGLEALEKIKSSRYDLIVTDIRMPEVDGIELIKRLKEIKYPARIIILSGYKDFEYARAAVKYGVKNYVLKPIGEDELINSLSEIKDEIEEELSIQELKDTFTNSSLKVPDHIKNAEISMSNKTVESIIKYTSEHYYEELSLVTLSKKYFMSPVYLGRLFKNTTGESFTDYVNQCRINSATKLLESDELMVCEISDRVGYKDINYFYKVFKSRKGITPSEYRLLYNKNKIM